MPGHEDVLINLISTVEIKSTDATVTGAAYFIGRDNTRIHFP